MHLYYDDEYEDWLCGAAGYMDEDDVARDFAQKRRECPFFRPGDEYTIVRKQN
jgi:hypothetical protein